MEQFDYVIIGAGTAGCTLALRLSQSGASVCVLEAGPPARNPFIRIPSGILKTSSDPRLTWRYTMQGSEAVNNREMPTFFGKTSGGSSAINGMMYNRGQRGDYDDWANHEGCRGWDFDAVLPYFRKSETYLDGGDPKLRGTDGPIKVGRLRHRDAITDRFFAACETTGMRQVEDYNGPDQEGYSYAQAQIHRGKRSFSADAYLAPACRRHRVVLRNHALVEQILIRDGQAYGLRYRQGGPASAAQEIHARREVLLCAGAIMSPKLLQLSGIGPSALLRRHGISIVQHAPAVGANLSDHFSVRMVARIKGGYGSLNEKVKFPHNAIEALKWFGGRPSILALTSMVGCTFNRLAPEDRDTGYSMFFLPAALKAGMTRVLDEFPGITGGGWHQKPTSRGAVEIRSSNIADPPAIHANFLATAEDQAVSLRVIRHLDRLFKAPPLAEIILQRSLPIEDCASDDEWLAYLRAYGVTSYHPAGTCRMGAPDAPHTVVDPQLKVLGIRGLRVIDASVMPTQVSGNLNAAVMMIAERGADLILGKT